ncbi:MAG: 2-oxoacid:acceptor oxidoreductase subunit alpha [Alphaproteobacteria bacterium]|nr:2-oxoacid:acceptor oxidoreductase subunit alpha [Alphaproteobacteria bacterium]
MTVAARPKTSPPVSIAVTGSGGTGVMTAGNMLLEAAALAGCYGFMGRTSGPQIRGGEAAALIRLASGPVEGYADCFDLLISVDWLNLERLTAEIQLGANAIVIGDPSQGEPPASIMVPGIRRLALPMKDMAKKIPGGRPNMVALGYVACLIGLPEAAVADAVQRTLGAESDRLAASLAAIKAGRIAASAVDYPHKLVPDLAHRDERWLMTGNEAAGYGALKGGVRFVAAYPITPATEMLEWMSPALTEIGGVLVQAEDELASINMAIGASYGGTPALTATSGPGLSLMMESLGLAVAAEVPIVVVDVMRAGPSTGIPTKMEQSDLNIALYGQHGDAPHVVVAPNSVADCLATTQWAVHLAEAMQVPVVVLSDQLMGQTRMVIDPPPDRGFVGERQLAAANGEAYRRYALTPSGISPMAIPGMAGLMYTADGLEHSERGTPSSQAKDHLAQLDKRERKLHAVDFGPHWADIEGEGEIAVLTWGSCTGAVREAIARARDQGIAVKLVSLRLLLPAQPDRLAAALAGVKRVLVVEQTHSGQFHRYLRAEHTLAAELKSMRRPGPLPMRPGDIRDELVRWSRP